MANFDELIKQKQKALLRWALVLFIMGSTMTGYGVYRFFYGNTRVGYDTRFRLVVDNGTIPAVLGFGFFIGSLAIFLKSRSLAKEAATEHIEDNLADAALEEKRKRDNKRIAQLEQQQQKQRNERKRKKNARK